MVTGASCLNSWLVIFSCSHSWHVGCTAASSPEGLRLKIKPSESQDGVRSAILADKVFYGRPILRIPHAALLQVNEGLDQKIRSWLQSEGPGKEMPQGSFHGEVQELLGLSLALLLEKRSTQPFSPAWLDAVAVEQAPLGFRLTEMQKLALRGTTAESACNLMAQVNDAILAVAETLEEFKSVPVAKTESEWALSVVLRHSQQIERPDTDGQRHLRLAMLSELLPVRLHADQTIAPALLETEVALGSEKEKVKVLLRVAGRDMPAGEEIFLWSGRLSDSELAVRSFSSPAGKSMQRNPTGIGGKVSIPESWNPNPRTPNFKEFRKFNCTSEQAFEVRLSTKGWPMRSFVRCYRVAWLLLNDHYSSEMLNQLELLDKWPPPKKYNHQDWLVWTQADQATNSEVAEYCKSMRDRLRDSINSSTAEQFRQSKDPTDKFLWKLRSEETKAFKECIALAKSTGIQPSAGEAEN
eukprot:TRINITY_DN35816_c0_g1_i1.p1 TRINITY_DN35816_c0_g1~~TRINITY_DN35816_c0_g1_i1.p1  ORF type:complete len:478 (-),score=77.68 TRINITY_DN35816_c0_g1_i1:16-1419(-)